jgi:hypothetical protein
MIWKSDLQRQINDLAKELEKIKSVDVRIEVGKMQTEIISIRGLINRKFGDKVLKEVDDDVNKKYGNSQCIPE